MSSANSLSPILRRLDEIERKLDRILEELQTPTAIGYSVRRGSSDHWRPMAVMVRVGVIGFAVAGGAQPAAAVGMKKGATPERIAPSAYRLPDAATVGSWKRTPA